MAFYQNPKPGDTVGQHLPWQAIITFGQHTQGRMASNVAFHHRRWTLHIVGRRRACPVIIAFGMNTQWDDVGHDNTIIAFGKLTWLEDVGC